MLKKWFIEKCCFTDYCTEQFHEMVLKAWKRSALENVHHLVFRQPSTGLHNVSIGGAALLFICKVELAGGKPLSQAKNWAERDVCRGGDSVSLPRSAEERSLPPFSAALLRCCVQNYKGRAYFCARPHMLVEILFWTQPSFHSRALATYQMLFLIQAALYLTFAYNVTNFDRGGSILFKIPLL